MMEQDIEGCERSIRNEGNTNIDVNMSDTFHSNHSRGTQQDVIMREEASEVQPDINTATTTSDLVTPPLYSSPQIEINMSETVNNTSETETHITDTTNSGSTHQCHSPSVYGCRNTHHQDNPDDNVSIPVISGGDDCIASTHHQNEADASLQPQIKTADNVVSDVSSISASTADKTSCSPQISNVCEMEMEIHKVQMHETENKVFSRESIDSRFSFSNSSCLFHRLEEASTMFSEHGEKENYLRGCKWSPDGLQVLTNSNDDILRTFSPACITSSSSDKEMRPVCEMRESGIVYDYAWHPGKSDSSSCRVICSCPGSPMHLWDSSNGKILASYRAFDHCDEITSAYSVSFSPDGDHLYGGYKNAVRIFDAEYSHRACTMLKTQDPKTKEGFKGIISCIGHGPIGSNLFATGSYSRHMGIYHTKTNQPVCLIQGHQGGVTHIIFSPDGNKLYTGGRKDPEIVCWDMRNMGRVLCTHLRDVQTNQRIYFDLSQSGRYLVSGNSDGSVQLWDTTESGHEVMAGEVIIKPCYSFQAHGDCTNGVSFNPRIALLATASGQRHFGNYDDGDTDSDDNDDDDDDDKNVKEFSLKVWSIPCVWSC